MKQKKLFLIILFVALISVCISIFSTNRIEQWEKIFQFSDRLGEIEIVMSDIVPENSYGREMRIVNFTVNDQMISLANYDNDSWQWHEDWGYTLYQTGQDSFVIKTDEPIHKISMEYVKQESSGIANIYVNGEMISELSMYRASWKNETVKYLFHNELQHQFSFVKNAVYIFIAMMILLFLLSPSKTDESKKYGVRNSLGMFDLAKGFCMCFVILWHTYGALNVKALENTNSVILGMFMVMISNGIMPMFFVISGYGFEPTSVAVAIKKQIKYLFLPYLVVGALVFVISGVEYLFLAGFGINELYYNMLPYLLVAILDDNSMGLPQGTIGPIWFCVALALAWIIFNIICKLKNKIARLSSVVVCFVIAYFLARINWRIGCFAQAFAAIPCLYIGYVLKKCKVFAKENKYTAKIYLLLFFVALLINGSNGLIEMSCNYWGNNYLVGMLASMLTSVLLIRIFLMLDRIPKLQFKTVRRIGLSTYYIIFIHSLEYVIIPWEYLASVVHADWRIAFIALLPIRVCIIYFLFRLAMYRNKKKRIKRRKRVGKL